MKVRKLLKLLNVLKYYCCARCDNSAINWHQEQHNFLDFNGRPTIHRNGSIFENIEDLTSWDSVRIIEHLYNFIVKLDDQDFLKNEAISPDLEEIFIDQINSVSFVENKDFDELKSLQYLFSKQDSIFIRHGVETFRDGQYLPGSVFPDAKDLQPFSAVISHGAYAIDTDTPPFSGCTMHAQRYGRDGVDPWSYCAGYISLEQFEAFGGSIMKFSDREHFYAKSNIPIEKWIFVWDLHAYQRIGKRYMDKANAELFEASIQSLTNGPHILLGLGLIRTYFEVAKLLQQRLDLMKIAMSVQATD